MNCCLCFQEVPNLEKWNRMYLLMSVLIKTKFTGFVLRAYPSVVRERGLESFAET